VSDENILVFKHPDSKLPQKTLAEIKLDYKLRSIDDLITTLSTEIWNVLVIQNGMKLDYTNNPAILRDFVLLMQALRSLIYREEGIEHPFQSFSEKLFELQADGSFILRKEILK